MPSLVGTAAGPSDSKGQARVIEVVRGLVDEWRGFPLGRASEPYPEEAPRYRPARAGEEAVSETTLRLLHHWFRHEPHTLHDGKGGTCSFKYWPHQRRLVETFLYLYEARGLRRTEELYALAGLEPLGKQRDPWAKLGGQLATGSGKTKMMSLIIAWSYLNSVCEGEKHLGLGRHAILIAPGLFVRDRLFQDFFPPRGATSVFFADPVIPPDLASAWNLKVYSPETCPLRLDPDEGALVVTNYHQLLRTREEAAGLSLRSWDERQMDLLFAGGEPQKLEVVQTPLLERFAQSRGLLVLNDEAHHVWDETGHQKFEDKAKDKARLNGGRGDETGQDATQMAWIRSIRKLHDGDSKRGRVALQVDLSATLYEEAGVGQKPAKGKATEFRSADLFRHAVVHYGLAEAIRDGIVKRPILERVEVRDKKTGQLEPLVREGQLNAWEKYRNILATGIERWQKVQEQLRDEGDARKPILFVLCNDRHEAKEIANFLTYGEPSSETLEHRTPTGYLDPDTKERLFVEKLADGTVRSSVVEIHIGEKEDRNEEEWEHVRQAVNAIDRDEIPDPSERVDEQGRRLMVPNPYNVVVSVMMLKEGWDVRNVKVIVPLRPCDSRTLTEQTLGRGLRRMHPPMLDEDGRVVEAEKAEELYVIEHPSFRAILDQVRDIIEERSKDEIQHARDYIPIEQTAKLGERDEGGVRLVNFEGLIEVVPDWRRTFDLERLPALVPRASWLEELAETEIQTFLKAALAKEETEGQTFTLPETPSYRDFDHVIEAAYAVPLLHELRTGYQHKNAVKGVVREFLERKTFALPLGVPLSFDKVIEGGSGLIALGNLARAEVMSRVRQALLPAIHEALTAERRSTEPQLSEKSSSELSSYQALRRNVLEKPAKTSFARAAFDSPEERRVAELLDRAGDVTGWIYNHRAGVGYSIEYDWQGYTAHYFPDFVARARLGEVVHNFIIEVKGRYDDRDKEKARRGRRHCELLSEYDREPWHYLLLIENGPAGREDITWWEQQSAQALADLMRRHEMLPLYPEETSRPARRALKIVEAVSQEEKYRDAVPVYDLAAAAGGFSQGQAPAAVGWAHVHSTRSLDRSMFVARVKGRSMEPAIPDGAWCLFRAFAAGEAPAATALDGRRLVVQLRDEADAETGGKYTLKRWRVSKGGAGGGAEEIELRPDNHSFKPRTVARGQADIRVVAEFLEVVA